MKPYIQVVSHSGAVIYMHDMDEDLGACDHCIYSDGLRDFHVDITDATGARQSFNFSSGNIAKLCARCIGTDTERFIEYILDNNISDLYELIDPHEAYYGEDGWSEELVSAITKNEAFDDKFFFRITQQADGKLVLSFVFHDIEIKSNPITWPEFTVATATA